MLNTPSALGQASRSRFVRGDFSRPNAGFRRTICIVRRRSGLSAGLLAMKALVTERPYRALTQTEYMSQHRSLRAAATLGGKRNVLKRFERLELLKKRGQWKPGDRITGLRKTKGEA
jgi:small basic protein (TIGR04137 family)